MVKGGNVMLGYYKNPEATKAIIDDDGWLHTGDIGTVDKNANIFIRGRKKSMILSASGQNIYPEEIEAVLVNYRLFLEVLVVERKNKPVALIFPDADYMKKHSITPEHLPAKVKETIKEANHHLAAYMRVADFEIVKEEFEKTPKKSIKRFKYQ
jgi:long-chain acyl-CoA synthetase